jgi:hypothetical protein
MGEGGRGVGVREPRRRETEWRKGREVREEEWRGKGGERRGMEGEGR